MRIEEEPSPPMTGLPNLAVAAGRVIEGASDEEPITVEIDREFTVESKTQRQLVVSRFFRHRLAMISLTVLVLHGAPRVRRAAVVEVPARSERHPRRTVGARRSTSCPGWTVTEWRSVSIRSGRTTSAVTTSP